MDGWTIALAPVLLLVAPLALIAWLSVRSPPVIRDSIRSAAAALSLPQQPAPHRRMQLFAGQVMDLRVEMASHADFFSFSAPVPLAHSYNPNVVLRALYARPLGLEFRIDTSRSAEESVAAGEVGLERPFKISTLDSAGLSLLLEPVPVREAIRALFGGDFEGSGRIVRLDQRGVYVHWSSPTPEAAAQLAHDLVRAAKLIAQRAAFLPVADVRQPV